MKAASSADKLSLAGQNQVANLMAEIGYKANIAYTCSGSGTSLESAKNCLTNMGYPNSVVSSYNWSNVYSDLNQGYPVLMGGHNSQQSGHVWVIEGYKILNSIDAYVRRCPSVSDEYFEETSSEKYLYFNLGQNGLHNGYYKAWSNSVENSAHYTYNLKTITNIR